MSHPSKSAPNRFSATVLPPATRSGPPDNPPRGWSQSRSLLALATLGILLTGTLGSCRAPESARASGGTPQESTVEDPVTVDVAIARSDTGERQRGYTGTTQPVRQVSAKSRVEGQVLQITVDAGDSVARGQVLARIDDRLLRADLEEAQAEYGARLTEVEEARYALAETQARVAEAKVALNRAQADAARFAKLAAEGAVPQ